MGKLMTIKPKGNKSITLSKQEINEFNRKIKQAEIELKLETIEMCALLFTAYAMEEEVIDRDAEKIVNLYEKLNEWAGSINDHTISINTVVDIINEATGQDLIHWDGGKAVENE